MPTQATIRKDPRNTGKGFSTRYGFTIVELMIVVAVVAIITSLALPSYRTILEKRQVTSGAEQIGAFLSSAQLEAVKRNQFVAVSVSYADSESPWCIGMRADDEASNLNDISGCDCTELNAAADNACALDGALRVFDSATLNYPGVLESATVGDSDNYFIFDPVRGLIVDFSQTTELELTSDQAHYAMNVQVTPTGRVKYCSDADRADMAVPGFEACQ